MHPSAAQNMQNFVNRYLVPLKEINTKLKIVDIGSFDVNGNLRSQFEFDNWQYIGIDINEGKNVDIVLEDPFKLPFDNNSIDVVVSANTIEHVEYPWKTFEEISRVIKEGGLICIIAPSFGGHHTEFDAWRILPDGMNSLCKWSALTVLECFIDPTDSWWLDCVLIATKLSNKNRKKGK